MKIISDKEESDYNCTYSFKNEDHKLGNIFGYILMKDHNATFCGYSNPHPGEDIINYRLQTKSTNTNEVVSKATDKAIEISDILS